MARDERLKRLRAELWLLEESEDGLTAEELASQLDVSTRTAQRDLKSLRSAGYPLSTVGARWRFVAGQPLQTTLAADGVNQAPERDRVMVFDRAIRRRRPVQVTYFPSGTGGSVTLSLAPLMLRYIDGSLFLIAREHPGGRLRAFALERLTQLKIDTTRYPREASAGLDVFVRNGLRSQAANDLERVTIRIEKPSVWRVTERIWHPSQRVVVDEDGRALVSFRVPGFTWIKAWVLGFGAYAVVLEPLPLVQAVREVIEEMRDRYSELSDHIPQLDLFDT